MGRMKMLSNIVNKAANQCEGFCIVKSVQQRSNVKGAEYLDMVLCDAEGEIVAKLWDYDAAGHGIYAVDDVIKVRGSISLWKDAEQLKIDKIRHALDGEAEMAELVPCAPFDCEWMYSQLFDTADAMEHGELRMLVRYLLKENREKLLTYPAATRVHHAVRGGLLYHTTSMLRAARALVEVYPALDRDLVFAGVILHDIAKTREMDVGALGLASDYTDEGKLVGHIALGVAMVEKAAAELALSDETRFLAEHMLLSHHGEAEFGSPKPPMFPEALVVSIVDLLDAQLYAMFDALSTAEKGKFTERVWSLDNRQLYKH